MCCVNSRVPLEIFLLFPFPPQRSHQVPALFPKIICSLVPYDFLALFSCSHCKIYVVPLKPLGQPDGLFFCLFGIGLVLGSFFFGYITTQIPGGFLASKYGGKNLFGGGILLASILTMLTPVATRRSVYLLIALRILEGVAQVRYNKCFTNSKNVIRHAQSESFFW